MNIRKKILFNPSHLKSSKPDTSDTTTAYTKNSFILQQSKTLRFSNNPNSITSGRSRNYLRTISKDQKSTTPADNIASNRTQIRKRNLIAPSLSTVSNENIIPIKSKGTALIQRNKFFEDELPPLINLKRTQLLTSQNQRKFMNFPSSLHISSNKELYSNSNTAIVKKQSFSAMKNKQQAPTHQKQTQPQIRILGAQIEEIQRKKQKFNSVNMGSFYSTYKSIQLSNRGGSVQGGERKNQSDGRDDKDGGKQHENRVIDGDKGKVSRFRGERTSLDKEKQAERSQLDNKSQLEEEIQEEISVKNESLSESKLNNKTKKGKVDKRNNATSNIPNLSNSFNQPYNPHQPPNQQQSNQWSSTLKSSFTQSKQQPQNPQNHANPSSQSSLCQSQQLTPSEVQQKKQIYRNRQSIQREQQESEDLCESYQIETPIKVKKIED